MTHIKLTNQFRRSVATFVVIASLLAVHLVAMPTEVEATLPGYNGKIAFQSDRDGNFDIYVMDADGENQTSLTNNSAPDEDPAWSPDGSKIAFRSERDGNQEIYVMSADGTEVTHLTNNSAKDVHPAWSPDGSKIVFASNRDGNYEIYRMNADGTNQTRLTTNTYSDATPDWSPDGTQIVFNSARPIYKELITIDADSGGNELNLTNNNHLNIIDDHASWSPNGLEITFYSNENANNDIYVVHADGSARARLTTHAGIDAGAFWSPDGTSIAFASNRDGNYEIYVMSADGFQQTRLTSQTGNDSNPAWQPIPNSAPMANDDSLSLQVNTSSTVSILTNDTDEEALDPAYLTIAIQPSHGTAAIVDGEVTYTPNADYIGSDKITYQICDSFMLDQKCATGVLGITVTTGPTPTTPTIAKVGTVTTDGSTRIDYTGARPTFSGTAEPGAAIRVEINSDPIILTTTANGAGEWSVTPDQDIPYGEHIVTITATKDGATSQALTFVLGINTGTIPNTGADASSLRLLGVGLLAAGSGLYVNRRRRRLSRLNEVPSLFP